MIEFCFYFSFIQRTSVLTQQARGDNDARVY